MSQCFASNLNGLQLSPRKIEKSEQAGPVFTTFPPCAVSASSSAPYSLHFIYVLCYCRAQPFILSLHSLKVQGCFYSVDFKLMAFFLIRTTPIHLSRPITNVIFVKCCPTHEKKWAHFPLYFHDALLFPLSGMFLQCRTFTVIRFLLDCFITQYSCAFVFMYTYVYVLMQRVEFNSEYNSYFFSFYIFLWEFHVMYPVLLPPSLQNPSLPLQNPTQKNTPQ